MRGDAPTLCGDVVKLETQDLLREPRGTEFGDEADGRESRRFFRPPLKKFSHYRACHKMSLADAQDRARSRNAKYTAEQISCTSERARVIASRRSVLTRSPSFRGINDGARHAVESLSDQSRRYKP